MKRGASAAMNPRPVPIDALSSRDLDPSRRQETQTLNKYTHLDGTGGFVVPCLLYRVRAGEFVLLYVSSTHFLVVYCTVGKHRLA